MRNRVRIIALLAGCFGWLSGVFAQCSVPTGLFTAEVTATEARLNWSPAASDSFLVRYREVGSRAYSYQWVAPSPTPSFRITGLKPNTTYEWQVRGNCSGLVSSFQPAALIFTTDAVDVNCIVPNQLVSANITASGVQLSWNSHITADSFMVRIRPAGGANYQYYSITGSSNSKSISGLTGNTIYEWSVAAVCNGVAQSYSPRNLFLTLCNGCDAPASTSDSVAANFALMNWSAVTGALNYQLRYTIRYSGIWTTTASRDTFLVLTGLRSSTQYEFQVRALTSSGYSAWTSINRFTTPDPPVLITRQPYLQQATSNSIFIRWRTDIPTDSRVTYGTLPNLLTRSSTDTSVTTEHIVKISGLQSDQLYYYTVGSSSSILAGDTGYYFRTHPPLGSTGPVHIWATGDMGTGAVEQGMVRDAYMNYCRANGIHTNLWLWLGDNAYQSGLDNEYQDNVFSMYPYQFRKWVCWPATGNHDLISADAAAQTGAYFENFTLPQRGEAGGIPSGTEAYYSYNYANIHFVVLESTDSGFRDSTGAQMNWLLRDLATSKQRWTIVYFHHPPYSKGSHNSDTESELIEMRTNFVPVFDRFRVDLVLCGHSHAYERSFLLRGHYGEESTFDKALMAVDSTSGCYPNPYVKAAPAFAGTVYTVCGVSGRISSTTTGWPHDAMFTASNDYFGSLAIDVEGDRMDCKFITLSGNVWDRFSIRKSGPRQSPLEPSTPGEARFDSSKLNGTPLIFPNPWRPDSKVLLSIDTATEVRLEIFDVTGRRLAAATTAATSGLSEFPVPVPTNGLSSGSYFLIATVADHSVSARLVVE